MSQIHRVPDERPTEGNFIAKQEVNYEIIIEWDTNGLTVKLNIRSSFFQDIVSDYESDCIVHPLVESHSQSTTPNTLDDFPPYFKQQMNDIVQVLVKKYELQPVEDIATCTINHEDTSEEVVQFSQDLTE